MLTASDRMRPRSVRSGARRARRGVALVFVLIFVTAMAALAMASIFMASNSNLLAKSYDRERDLKYAAEMALAMGKSRVNQDPLILTLPPGKLDTAILTGYAPIDAYGRAMRGITVNVYVGPTGSTSGQFGRFSSIVAEARDERGNGFIRRLELSQESFAKFAYWSNSESNNGTTIFFNNKDELWGPVWSNDVISIGSGGAIFHDEVGTAKTVSGAAYGTFSKGYKERQTAIQLPSVTSLNSTLPSLAGPYNFTSSRNASGSESEVLDRVEFVAVDLNGNGNVMDPDEGFFRVFKANTGNEKFLRGDWPGTSSTAPTVAQVDLCGDYHWAPRDDVARGGDGLPHLKFYPVSVHPQTWFRDQIQQGYIDKFGWTAQVALDNANAEQARNLQGILSQPGARCFLAGSPELAAVERLTTIDNPKPGLPVGTKYTLADIQIGGTDTTFTPVGKYGSWQAYSAGTNDVTYRPLRPWDGRWLFPIDRKYNTSTRGVIYFSGNVGVSGTMNGHLTLYTPGTVVLLDDLRYANDPALGRCRDILGIIGGRDVVIADNAINTPPDVVPGRSNPKYYSLDDTKDMYIHSVLMALQTSFRVENYGSGPTDVNDCDISPTQKTNNGRGCIYLSGGIIQVSRGAVGQSTSSGVGQYGFTKRYSYDRCAVASPPPYFPTTGRFQDNRYIELDPAGFDHTAYFKSLDPDK